MRNFKRLKNNKEIFKIKGKTHTLKKTKPKLITRSWNIKFSGYIQIINKGRHTHKNEEKKKRANTHTHVKKLSVVCAAREREKINYKER